MWRNSFGGGFGPVVRQNTEWMNEWMNVSVVSVLISFQAQNSVIKIKIQGIPNNSFYGILGLTPCNLIIGYYYFGRICCVRLQNRIKEGTTVANYKSTIHWRNTGSDAAATISPNRVQSLCILPRTLLGTVMYKQIDKCSSEMVEYIDYTRYTASQSRQPWAENTPSWTSRNQTI